jgi:hypothetical protein
MAAISSLSYTLAPRPGGSVHVPDLAHGLFDQALLL